MEEGLAILGMFILRLGIPLAITLGIGYALRRLDARWEAEAVTFREQEAAPVELQALKTVDQPCWEVKGCDEDSRAKCPACKAWDIPCWVARLRATGRLPAECHGCEIFSLSPAT